jgi:CRISP-associated protein Cas1
MALLDDPRRTVYLNTIGSHVALDHDALEIRRPDQPLVRTAIKAVESIICYGNIEFSTAALARCAHENIPVTWLSRTGKYRFSLKSPTHGNVLLRIEQHKTAADPRRCLDIAQSIVAAKLLNTRTMLLDAAKDHTANTKRLRNTADELAKLADRTPGTSDLDTLRGLEGAGAKQYFATWEELLASNRFKLPGRERRPPTDPVNALLSFLYGLLRVQCNSALEHVGLDPQIGLLHPARPGRPSLALDLMEELRAPFADRLALTLLNRRQLDTTSFTTEPTGAVKLNDDARLTVLRAFDTHLTTEVPHRVLDEPIERRKIPHLQALLLARHLRGDLTHYLPYRTTGR